MLRPIEKEAKHGANYQWVNVNRSLKMFLKLQDNESQSRSNEGWLYKDAKLPKHEDISHLWKGVWMVMKHTIKGIKTFQQITVLEQSNKTFYRK